MEITWLGHSCFRIAGKEVSILTDPFPPGLGLPPYRVTPSIVTVSNSHPNHSYTLGPEGSPRVLTRPGEYDISGVYIRGLRTTLREDDAPVPRNTVFLMHVEDLVVCHLGDLGAVPTPGMVESLSEAHVLLIPASGGCTMDVAQAVETVNLIQPRVVVPMHYRVNGAPPGIGTVEAFLREIGARDLSPAPSLTLTASSLPGETRVVLLSCPSA